VAARHSGNKCQESVPRSLQLDSHRRLLAHCWRASFFLRGATGLVTGYGAINPLNAKLNPICHLLALLGAHPLLHISKIRVNLPRCSPDLAPSDFSLFGPSKKQPTSKGFVTDADMKTAVTSWLQTLHNIFLYTKLYSLGATVGPVLTFREWLHRALVCTICDPRAKCRMNQNTLPVVTVYCLMFWTLCIVIHNKAIMFGTTNIAINAVVHYTPRFL
jgi:hypothetical protein